MTLIPNIFTVTAVEVIIEVLEQYDPRQQRPIVGYDRTWAKRKVLMKLYQAIEEVGE